LPRWLIDLSPVGRTTAPMNYPVIALTVMAVIAAALTLVAGWIHRSRDAL
jgi:ABC-2 type transport system permease protein